jgi:hypothetical protein
MGYVIEKIKPTIILFSDEAWFHFSGYLNSQNKRYWSADNPVLLHQVPLHSIRVASWCAARATRVIGPVVVRYDTSTPV